MGDRPPHESLSAADRRWLKRAVRLGARGRFGVSPNPAVGCVLVSDGRLVGQGWHRRYGHPHAEVEALQDCHHRCGDKASELLHGATAYITLEPCAHHGKTPPCTEALLDAGIGRIICALVDPNRRVAGKGFAILQQAGVEVICGAGPQLQREAVLGNLGYLSHHARSRPWLTLKLAAGLDGRTALKDGTSQWITGPEARADVQVERACSDVILTGIGTIVADNPRLLPRREDMPAVSRRDLPSEERQPLRLVLDTNLRIPADAALFGLDGPIAIACADGAEVRRDDLPAAVEQIVLPTGTDGRPALEQLLPLLHERGCNRVLTECGPTLAGALMRAGLVDEVLLYQSGRVLGSDGWPLWQLTGPAQLSGAEFELATHTQLGEDIRLQWVRSESLEALRCL